MRASPVKRAFRGGRLGGRAAGGAVVGFRRRPGGVARANNGIPGSLGVLLPLDKPQEIGLATTFGLILSDDGGAELGLDLRAARHVDGQRLHRRSRRRPIGSTRSRSLTGLSFSDDESCGWQSAGGALAGQKVSDFFTDPSDPMRVLAAASPATDGGGAALASVYASTDGGATFGATPLYTAPAGASIVGIEIARSDPQVIYLTYVTATQHRLRPGLVRSADGGAHLDDDRSARRRSAPPSSGSWPSTAPTAISSICGRSPRRRRRWR